MTALKQTCALMLNFSQTRKRKFRVQTTVIVSRVQEFRVVQIVDYQSLQQCHLLPCYSGCQQQPCYIPTLSAVVATTRALLYCFHLLYCGKNSPCFSDSVILVKNLLYWLTLLKQQKLPCYIASRCYSGKNCPAKLPHAAIVVRTALL